MPLLLPNESSEWGNSGSAECLRAAVEAAYVRGTPTGKERGQGKGAVMAEAEMHGGLEAVAHVVHLRTAVGLLGIHWLCSPNFSLQSSQPSITSPFKQEVFAYSPSPSSENPSLGATGTPIIMSRSPTGQ